MIVKRRRLFARSTVISMTACPILGGDIMDSPHIMRVRTVSIRVRDQDEQFDVILNPVSTLFVPELTPVWSECHRTLIPGGVLITGFLNPDEFAFDADALDQRGEFIMRHPLPYIEHDTLSPAEAAARRAAGEMFHFSHTMQAQLGGILGAGFIITGFFEDRRLESDGNPISRYLPSYFVVRAERRLP